MKYPVERLNKIDPVFAARAWLRSLESVEKMKRRDVVMCPTCRGNKALVSYIAGFDPVKTGTMYDCPTCNGVGNVTLPCPHDCIYGGWYCCPVCGEGQNQTENDPCDICSWIIDNDYV